MKELASKAGIHQCAALLAIASLSLSACAHPDRVVDAASFGQPLFLAAEFIIPAGAVFAALDGARFGGISGIAALNGRCDLLAVSDDPESTRLFHLRLSGAPPAFSVSPVKSILLRDRSGAPERLDAEGIAVGQAGRIFISSEGEGDDEPRVPPAIAEYSVDGRFVRRLPVPARFVPNARGSLSVGVRSNAGFESLTVSPDFRSLFTGNELPLVQDGLADAFAERQAVRLIEYSRVGDSYRPGREFAYTIAPLQRPAFDIEFTVNGLVELLSLGGRELLALERGYIQSKDRRQDINRIRIFRISLDGATDVSDVESLAGASAVVPVKKTLVADLNRLPGLSPALRNLDNFEGLAFGPSSPAVPPSLIVVSDDNFNTRQVTAFLVLEPGTSAARGVECR